jgi:hypothetical protein
MTANTPTPEDRHALEADAALGAQSDQTLQKVHEVLTAVHQKVLEYGANPPVDGEVMDQLAPLAQPITVKCPHCAGKVTIRTQHMVLVKGIVVQLLKDTWNQVGGMTSGLLRKR